MEIQYQKLEIEIKKTTKVYLTNQTKKIFKQDSNKLKRKTYYKVQKFRVAK